jgi:hypothetical protein
MFVARASQLASQIPAYAQDGIDPNWSLNGVLSSPRRPGLPGRAAGQPRRGARQVAAIARGRDGRSVPAGICWVVERSFAWLSRYRRIPKTCKVGFPERCATIRRYIKPLATEELGA